MANKQSGANSVKLSRAELTGVAGGTAQNAGTFSTKADLEKYLHDSGYLAEGQAMTDVVSGWNNISDADLEGRNVILGNGSENVYGTDGNDLIISFGDAVGISGGAGDDIIFGNSSDNIISGGNGNDRIFGGNGTDFISGGDGNDDLHGGQGDDFLSGDNGHDILLGGQGDDLLSAGAGADVLLGGTGEDAFYGDENDVAIDSQFDQNP